MASLDGMARMRKLQLAELFVRSTTHTQPMLTLTLDDDDDDDDGDDEDDDDDERQFDGQSMAASRQVYCV